MNRLQTLQAEEQNAISAGVQAHRLGQSVDQVVALIQARLDAANVAQIAAANAASAKAEAAAVDVAQTQALQQATSDLTAAGAMNKGFWSYGSNYHKGDVVLMNDGTTWVATTNHDNADDQVPGSGTGWARYVATVNPNNPPRGIVGTTPSSSMPSWALPALGGGLLLLLLLRRRR